MTLRSILVVALFAVSNSLTAGCKEDCQTNYKRCKADVQKKGKFSYFGCLNAEKECDNSCKR